MVTVEILEKQLKNKELHSIYLLYGEELYLLEVAVKKIKKLFGELVKGINYIEIEDTNLKEWISNIETPAFGFEKKIILVKNTGIFKREVKRKSAEVTDMRDKINDYLKENDKMIQESVILVFIEESVDKGKLLTTLEESKAIICNFECQKPVQLAARLHAICRAYNVKIEDTVMKYFIECVGTNMQDLMNEIRKQIEYAGENATITKESIDKLVIRQMESVIFELTDNLGKKNIKKSMLILNNLIYSKEPVQKILITLYNHFKKIYMVKLATRQNRNVAEVLNLKPNQMFLTTKYKAQSEYFEEQELKEILQEFIKLDANYKIGLMDINVGLESILCYYCS